MYHKLIHMILFINLFYRPTLDWEIQIRRNLSSFRLGFNSGKYGIRKFFKYFISLGMVCGTLKIVLSHAFAPFVMLMFRHAWNRSSSLVTLRALKNREMFSHRSRKKRGHSEYCNNYKEIEARKHLHVIW